MSTPDLAFDSEPLSFCHYRDVSKQEEERFEDRCEQLENGEQIKKERAPSMKLKKETAPRVNKERQATDRNQLRGKGSPRAQAVQLFFSFMDELPRRKEVAS